MQSFLSLGLNNQILKNLIFLKFLKPTPIQIQAIKPALSGRDILGSAHTGTGKTAAFGIPLIQRMVDKSVSNALILTPTRELADQVNMNINNLMKNLGIRSLLIIGGESIRKQLRKLKDKPRLIIGTPGRINDHLIRGSLNLEKTNFLVLDETDRMLDMGFKIQIEKIIKYLPKRRQTLLFSATLPNNIREISRKYLYKPINISVDNNTSLFKKITHQIFDINQNEKFTKLVEQIKDRNGSIIIFIKTKYNSKKISTKLNKEGFLTNAIHGDLKQNQREIVLNKFRKKKYRILVATDIAARGLDISHIEHVINYDLPQKPEDFIHRIGRTARAGLKGEAISYVTPNDKKNWNEINKLIHPNYKNTKERTSKFKLNKLRNNKFSKTKNKKYKTKKNSKKNFFNV